MLDEHNVRIIDNVHGLTVYDEAYPVATFNMSGGGLVSPITVTTIAEEISRILQSNLELSRKELLALELYGASHYENSDRARFLTLVLALEGLLESQNRSSEVLAQVDQLIESVKHSRLPDNEKKSLEGSLRWLYTESISRGLRNFAETYLPERNYDNMTSVKFMSHCYEVRSKLVHTGRVAEDIHMGALAANLNVFVSDLLSAKLNA